MRERTDALSGKAKEAVSLRAVESKILGSTEAAQGQIYPTDGIFYIL